MTSKILKSAAKDIRFLKTAIECKTSESIRSEEHTSELQSRE